MSEVPKWRQRSRQGLQYHSGASWKTSIELGPLNSMREYAKVYSKKKCNQFLLFRKPKLIRLNNVAVIFKRWVKCIYIIYLNHILSCVNIDRSYDLLG